MKSIKTLAASAVVTGALLLTPVVSQAQYNYNNQDRHHGQFYNGVQRGGRSNYYNHGSDYRYNRGNDGRYQGHGIGTGTGAAIGGAGGAALGALFGGGLKGALIGGAAGAGIGAIAGHAHQNNMKRDYYRRH